MFDHFQSELETPVVIFTEQVQHSNKTVNKTHSACFLDSTFPRTSLMLFCLFVQSFVPLARICEDPPPLVLLERSSFTFVSCVASLLIINRKKADQIKELSFCYTMNKLSLLILANAAYSCPCMREQEDAGKRLLAGLSLIRQR